jgi:hypothetical protein
LAVGCGSTAKDGGGGEDKLGNLALPLVTQGASGLTYRLRDATFLIHHYNYGPYMGVGGSVASGGTGAGGGDEVTTVSSETDPNAQTISLSVEEGEYYVELLPGWHFEKAGPMGAEIVDATLLSGETQWVYVSRQSTSFAEFQFGLGGRELWLNGELNIGVVLYEDPSELNGYGGTGYGGSGGGYTAGTGGAYIYAAGAPSGGTGSVP